MKTTPMGPAAQTSGKNAQLYVKSQLLAVSAKKNASAQKSDEACCDKDRFERGRSPTVRGLVAWNKLTMPTGATTEHIEYKMSDVNKISRNGPLGS